MPVIQVHELAGMTREVYEDAMRELALPGPPPGSHLHAGGPMDGGWRIVEVWESEAARGGLLRLGGVPADDPAPGDHAERRRQLPGRDRAEVTPGGPPGRPGRGGPSPAARPGARGAGRGACFWVAWPARPPSAIVSPARGGLMKRRPVLATLGGLGVLGSLAGAGSAGPAALAGGDPAARAGHVGAGGPGLGAHRPDRGGPADRPGRPDAVRRHRPGGRGARRRGGHRPVAGRPGRRAVGAPGRPVPRVADLAAHPDDPRLLYVAGDGGVHRSLDAGATWERVVVPLPSYAGLRVVVSPADPALLYATTGIFSGATIWRSLNGGAGWEALRNLQGTLCTWTFPVIAPDPAVRQRVYLSYSCAAGRTFSASLSVSDDLWATDGATLLRPTVTAGAPLSFLFPAAAAFDPAGQAGGGRRPAGRPGGGQRRARHGRRRGVLARPAQLPPGAGARPATHDRRAGTVATSLLAEGPELRRLVVGLAGRRPGDAPQRGRGRHLGGPGQPGHRAGRRPGRRPRWGALHRHRPRRVAPLPLGRV